jgi:hypothetical protein
MCRVTVLIGSKGKRPLSAGTGRFYACAETGTWSVLIALSGLHSVWIMPDLLYSYQALYHLLFRTIHITGGKVMRGARWPMSLPPRLTSARAYGLADAQRADNTCGYAAAPGGVGDGVPCPASGGPHFAVAHPSQPVGRGPGGGPWHTLRKRQYPSRKTYRYALPLAVYSSHTWAWAEKALLCSGTTQKR